MKNGLLKHHGKHTGWINWPVYGWVSEHQAVKQRISPSWGAPTELGLGGHLPWGWAPGPLCSASRSAYWCTSPLKWGARTDRSPSQRIALPCMVPQLLWVGCWQLMLDHSPLIPPPKGLCDFHKPGQMAWGLVVRLQQHLLPGRSSRCICLLGGSGSVFAMGCWQGPPWVGQVASGVTAMWVSWDGFQQPGWAHLHPIGGCNGYKNLWLLKGDQRLHHLLEFHHTFCQMARLTRNWQLGLLCPILKHPHIGKGLVWLGESVVLTAGPHIWGWHEMILPYGQMHQWDVWSFPSPLPNYMPSAPQMRHAPSRQTPGSCPGWGSSEVPPTRLASPHVKCTTVSNLTGTGERALGLQSLMLAGAASHLPPLCQPVMIPLHPGVPGGRGPAVGDLLCLPLTLTSQPHCMAPSQSVSLAGASSGLCLFWHHFPDSLLSVRVPSLWWRSPNNFAWWDCKTGSALKQYPCGGRLPGGLLLWLQVPHSGKSCGNLLFNILRTWTSCISDYQSMSGCWSIASWWSSSFTPSFLQGLLLPPGPIGGCPSLGPSFPHTNPILQQWTSHMCCS